MVDLVEKLRAAAKFGGHYAAAADEIQSLREENSRLRRALEGLLRCVDNAKWRDPVGCPLETTPHVEDARAALKREGE